MKKLPPVWHTKIERFLSSLLTLPFLYVVFLVFCLYAIFFMEDNEGPSVDYHGNQIPHGSEYDFRAR